MQIESDCVLKFLEVVAARIKEQRDYLTELDAAIGDADHGVNLDRGFSAVMSKLPTLTGRDIGSILRTVGTTLVSTVGGASGPLYGTAFIRAGAAAADRFQLDPYEFVVVLEAALRGIETRGKATRGEKTMLDAIAPFVETLKAGVEANEDPLIALRKAVAACEEGMRATIPMLATKGRASYLGERSIGHQDPGATSAYLMARAMLDVVEERNAE
ncbi:MAG: dihydroxyacetone kinase subunit DhaL [Oscillochloridaceae bacterium]|nr:dihydroxyacetone kinase subunit DhaL [Chloroflexaceae bacterium]MDW8389634.1 dihydroxyacetone kinase subunit DhaL [Oscillochloridaceae bacterium]